MAEQRKYIETEGEGVLFVYYSGHGDAGDLHLGHEKIPVDELRRLVESAGAKFRLLVVDACRSGGVTGVRGATPAAPFSVRIDEDLENRGTAIITSATAAEFALESERWGGSIFTRALISGLRGAADLSQDGAVTLDEAYAYAYRETLKETRRTVTGPQHPTFEYDLAGRGSVVLSRTGRAAGSDRLGLVVLDEPGRYIFLDRAGNVAYEVAFDAGGRRVLLDPGRYAVELRRPEHLRVGEVSVEPGGTHSLDVEIMREVAYAEALRRGERARAYYLEPEVGFGARARLGAVIAPGFGPRAGVALHLADLSLRLGLEAHRSARRGVLAGTVDLLGASLGAAYTLDFSGLSLGLGANLGVLGVEQRFSPTRRLTPTRRGLALFAGPELRVGTRLGGRFGFAFVLGLDAILLRERLEGGAGVTLAGHLAPRAALAIGVQL